MVSKKKKKKVFTEIESDFSAEVGNSNVFFAQNQVVSKKKKGLHRNWEWFFGRSRKFKRFFRPKSGGLQKKKFFFAQNQVVSKKKKKKVFTETESDFSAEIGNSNVFFRPKSGGVQKIKKGLHRNWKWFFGRNRKIEAGGGDASQNGTEFIEIEADFLAKTVTFRLVGGMHPPIPP